MGLQTNNPVFLVDPKQSSPPGLKDLATRIVNQAKTTSPDDPIGLVGRSVGTIGSQLATLLGYLKQAIPLPEDFYLTDPSGRVITKFGFDSMNATQIYGLSTFDLGGGLASFVGVQTELPKAITATTNASPDVITIVAHGYSNGDTLLIQNSLGDTAINIIGIVENKTANTFQLTDLLGNPINGNGAYGGSGTATRYFGGGYFQTLAIGGTSVPTAKIRAFADGNVTINGARIELHGSAAMIVLDPVLGQITVAGVSSGLTTIISSFGVTVNGAGSSSAFLVNGVLTLTGTTGTVVTLDTSNGLTMGPWGVVILPSGDANFKTVSINALLILKNDGTVNAQGVGVQVNGTTRIDSSGNVHSANGANGTCPLAKLTGGGSDGSFTVADGVVTAFTAPT